MYISMIEPLPPRDTCPDEARISAEELTTVIVSAMTITTVFLLISIAQASIWIVAQKRLKRWSK